MAAMTDFLENKILDYLFRGTSFGTMPTTLYVALYTTTPTDVGGGVEVTGGSYARCAVASNLTNWAGTQGSATTAVSSGNTGTTSNNIALNFPTPSASWGTVRGFAIMDASTGGNMWIYGALSAEKPVSFGDAAPSFAISQLQITMDN